MAVAFGLSVVSSLEATAAAQRTFVASTGNDAHPCGLAQPCRGFARAITQTNAGGEVIVLDSAGYGPVTITKSVSLIAPAGIYAGITVVGGDGITIIAPSATVVLRGLSINGQGGSHGVNVLQAERARIESCVVSGMSIDGIMYSAPGLELIVLDTMVRDNGGSGIGGDADASVVLDHVRSEHNGTNGFYMASLSDKARAMISDSIFAFNGSNGVWVAATNAGTTNAQIERSVLADNGANGLKISASIFATIAAAVTRNAVHRNIGDGVMVIGPGFAEAGVSDNTFLGSDGFISASLHADGSKTRLWASANHFSGLTSLNFVQTNSAIFWSHGNNTGSDSYSGTYVQIPTF